MRQLVALACLWPRLDAAHLRLRFLNSSALELVGGNVTAVEGGTVVRVGAGYGLFTTDISRGIVDTRLVYYEASGRGGPFSFGGVLVCCSSGRRDGCDNRASLWAPVPSYDGGAWHLFYVQYASASNNQSGWYSNFHGEIVHAVSTSGKASGPYADVGVVLRPDAKSQDWEGLQGTDSLSPPFRLPNGSWAAFYSSAHTEARPPPRFAPPHRWNVGLALAGRLGEPFRRVAPSALVNLNGGASENPLVARIWGVYVAIFDDLAAEANGFGLSTSLDGLHWSPGELVQVPGGVRTPQGLLQEPDGTLSLFYSAGRPERPWVAALRAEGPAALLV